MAEEQAIVPSQAVPESMKAVTKFTAEHAHEVRLPSPEALNYMVSVAKLLLDSTLITSDMGSNPEQIKANALAKMLVGLDFEMSPMESLQEIDIVKSRIFIRYPRLMGAMERKGLQPRWVERTNVKCSLEVTRPGRNPEMFEYTIEDARMAGLVRQGSQYDLRPRVMLSARCVSEGYRMTGGKSNVYTPEEREEITEHEPADPDLQQQPENRFTVGRKPSPEAGSNAEFAAAGKALAETAKGEPVKAETKPAVAETKPPESEKQAPASRNRKCGCVDGECMMLGGGTLPHEYFCREGRTLGKQPQQVQSGPQAQEQEAPQTEPASADAGRALREKLLARLNELTDYYKEQAPKNVMSKFNNFFRGVLGVTTLPKDPDVFTGLLPALESAIRSDKAAFWKDPTGAGRIEAEDRKVIQEHLEVWKWNSAMLPYIYAAKYRLGGTGEDICDYIEKSHGLTKLPPASAEAFLRMAAVSREVYRMKPISESSGMSYETIVQQLEVKMDKPIEQFTEEEFVSVVKIGEQSIEEAKRGAAPAAKPAPAAETATPAAAGEQEGLPWDTEA